MQWIVVTSPRLLSVHRLWMSRRGARLIPDVRDYNDFIGRYATEPTAQPTVAITVPPNGGPPAMIVSSGLLDSGATAILNQRISLSLREVCDSRQPCCHRGRPAASSHERGYEILLLPFDDGRFRVCLILAVFDIPELH